MSQWIQLFRSGARTGWANMAVELTPVTVLGSRIPRTILQAVFFILISYAAGGSELAKFALIGNTMHAAVFHSIIEMSVVIELEKWIGTMPYLIASPANWFPAMMGRSLAGYVEGLIRILLVLLILVPFFGGDLRALDLLRAAPIFIVTVASASALGWFSGAMSLPTRWGMLVCNTIGYIMMLTGGVNFPVTALPPVIQWLGRILPMTNGLLAIRAVIDGATYHDVTGLILNEVLIGLAYGALAWQLFSRRLDTARKTGNIELF